MSRVAVSLSEDLEQNVAWNNIRDNVRGKLECADWPLQLFVNTLILCG